ncbi:unnamed protein product [Acanthosepion pharaonis]|uniref:non-specific serine/threonine protein kinase n=1 Tax=Acanthosepion pharaonis TaxID=158019 RepID=A0A812E4B2_ACAPH|nr:unnamed protein product [Sepia pharaonis]
MIISISIYIHIIYHILFIYLSIYIYLYIYIYIYLSIYLYLVIAKLFETFSFCLARLSFCLARLSFCLARLSFCLARLSFCLARLSFCLARLSFCLARLSLVCLSFAFACLSFALLVCACLSALLVCLLPCSFVFLPAFLLARLSFCLLVCLPCSFVSLVFLLPCSFVFLPCSCSFVFLPCSSFCLALLARFLFSARLSFCLARLSFCLSFVFLSFVVFFLPCFRLSFVCLARLSFCLARLSFCLARLSFCLARLSFCLARLSFCLARLSFCLARLSFCLARLSFCLAFSFVFLPCCLFVCLCLCLARLSFLLACLFCLACLCSLVFCLLLVFCLSFFCSLFLSFCLAHLSSFCILSCLPVICKGCMMSGEEPTTEERNSLDDWPGQMIHQAAIYNNSELMQCLLEGDEVANINNVDGIGRTAVYTAVTNQSMECLKHLIRHGANINLPGGPKCQNNTPLHIAVKEGLYDMVVMLLEAGAEINNLDKFNMTPLKVAELKGDLSIYNCLNEEKAKRDAQWKSLAEDFLVACRRGDVSMAKRLRDELGSRAETVIDALQYNKALSHKSVFVATLLFLANITVVFTPPLPWPVLRLSSSPGQYGLCPPLLPWPVWPLSPWPPLPWPVWPCPRLPWPVWPLSPLPWPVRASVPAPLASAALPCPAPGQCAASVPAPLASAASVPAPLASAASVPAPLASAASVPAPLASAASVPAPLASAASVPAPSQSVYLFAFLAILFFADVPLHVCKAGEKDLVRILLTVDLETDCTSFGEKSPLHLVCEHGHLEVALLLLEKCSEHVATRCPTGKLALHYAAINGQLDIVALLFEFPYPDHVLMEMSHKFGCIKQHFHHAFDPNTLDFDSKSALYYACENGHYNVVKYMLHRQVMACRTCEPLPQIQINSRKDSETVMTMSQIPSMIHVCKPFTSNGLSPLHVSVLHNFEEIVSILLETGASTDAQPDPNEMTFALKTACDHGFIHLMDLLLQYGAKDDRNHILLAAEISHDVDMLAVILKYKTVADPHCHVDRARVRQKVAELSLISEVGSEESFTSTDLEGHQNYPMTAVSLCWQDLRILTYVHMSWLVSASLFHNPHLNSSQSQLSLCSITRINLEHNRLQQFPPVLFELTSLCYLDVSHNDIGSFPADNLVSADKLWPNLVKLDISYNRLFTFPGYIFHLPVLFYLNASHNCLESIPEDFWFSTHLENVNFSNNNLRSFVCPASRSLQTASSRKKGSTQSVSGGSVSSVSSSDVFILSHSESQNLDDYEESTFSYGMKMDVQHFVYWHTCLQVSTENVAPTGDENNRRLGLKVLNLSGNYLKEVPDGLPCYFPNLDQLNLSQNDIYSWGSLSHYPPMLRELDLSHNMLINMTDKLPSSLGTSESSTCYNTKQTSTSIWRHCATPSFSSYIQDLNACPHRQHRILVNLQMLNLSYNRLSSVTFLQPHNFLTTGGSSSQSRNSGSLENTYGSSSSPGIPLLPVVIFPNLTTLDISNNRLSNLTKDIGQVSQLKMLNLSGNEIRELPPEMGLLKRLWKLDLDHCPLEGAVHDLMLQNRSAVEITGFLNSVLEAECEYSCLNLMLVGTHNVGKTSLLMQLRKLCKVPKDSRPKHWVERVGGGSPAKGKLLSTVGIDMDEVILDKSTKGPITFRTWDFGGQREYYATHRYFLLKRSLYLVIWKITDGEEGVNGMLQWLINIQSQAPGSSVIIIGTHLDILKNRATRNSFPKDFEDAMMKLISERYMVPEPDKCGLPNVIDAWNVSNITGNNVKKLLQRIYDQAFALRHPRSKRTLLLKQKIPKKYLYLQEIVQEIADEKKARGEDPVLSRELYKIQVMNKMMERIGTSFRDVAELDQATHFLHENGVLCHYEDVNLSDTYFLDPQWLCDQLAKVVTIREVNKFAINGVMYMKDLGLLYKSLTRTNHSGSQGYMLDLLSKFELALQFDKDKLLVPSLLPAVPCEKQVRVKLKVEDEDSDESRSLSGSNEVDMDTVHYFGNATFYLFAEESTERKERARSFTEGDMKKLSAEAVPVTWERCQFEPIYSMCRLYQLMYFPSGFWPQVITRLLADKRIYPIAKNLFEIENCCAKCKVSLDKVLVDKIKWRCWQKQIELVYGNHVILSVKEAGPDSPSVMCDFSHCSVLCHMGQRWEMLDLRQASVLELCFPTNRYVLNYYHLPQSVINGSPVVQVKNPHLHSARKTGNTQESSTDKNCHFCGNQTPSQVTIVRKEKASSKLLARVIEHVDNLLQDWYPELGEQRFIQNIHGQYLVSRLVPCLCCLTAIHHNQQKNSETDKESWVLVNNLVCESELSLSIENSVEEKSKDSSQSSLVNSTLHCFLVEECMLNVLDQKPEVCPVHGNLSQYWVASEHELHKLYLAPEIVFRDIDDSLLLAADQITQVESLGKGAFGVVCRGFLHRENMPVVPCAIKNLSDNSQQTATIDHRMFAAVHAYTAARQEIEILQSLRHPNIVELLGIVVHPMALVLALAPHGSLNTILKVYRDKQDMLPVFAVKCVISQIASALSYLHSKGIIYRDLKSENVLVWSFPYPLMTKPEFHVDVRLADYGISRMSLPTGTKGFGGTPPFIAPEILQHAGKDIYTDKVDSFSFGMFIYELVTCKPPLWGESHVNNFICQGGRPKITLEESECPSHFLDLMTLCWSQEPKDRPSMEDIITLASYPEFSHFMDAISLEAAVVVLASCVFFYNNTETSVYENLRDVDGSYTQLWLSTRLADKNMVEVYIFYRNKCVESKVSQ